MTKLPQDKRPPPGATIKVAHRRIKGSEKYYDVRGLHFEANAKRIHIKGYTDSGCDVLVDFDAFQLIAAFDSWRRAQEK